MAQSRRDGQEVLKEAEAPGERDRQNSAATEAAQRQAGRPVESGGEQILRAAEASAASASGALRSGSAIAADAQEIAAVWVCYAEDIARHNWEASQALLRARTFSEMLEVQTKFLRDNMQSFVNQGLRLAQSTSRMATRPFDTLRQARGD